jgi:hypothetical protein
LNDWREKPSATGADCNEASGEVAVVVACPVTVSKADVEVTVAPFFDSRATADFVTVAFGPTIVFDGKPDATTVIA